MEIRAALCLLKRWNSQDGDILGLIPPHSICVVTIKKRITRPSLGLGNQDTREVNESRNVVAVLCIVSMRLLDY